MAEPTEQAQADLTPETTPPGDQVDVTPSSSDGGDDQSSFLDVLTKATEQSSSSEEPQAEDPEAAEEAEAAQAADPEAEAGDQPQDKQDDDPGDELPDEPTEAELKAMSARTKRRIEKLLAERKEARTVAEAAKPILDYMRKNDIPQQDVDVVLGMAAQLRHGDFAGFLRTVEPYVKLARQYTGAELPPDLKKQVDQGFVSPEVAQELAYRRAQEQVSRQQAQHQQVRQEQEVRNLRGQTIRTAVQNWEAQTKATDPDYEAKADIVRRTAQALMVERGVPQTPEQALTYVKEAYEEANKAVAKFRPAPKPTQPQPSSVHQAPKSPSPEPSNMFDVVRQAVGG